MSCLTTSSTTSGRRWLMTGMRCRTRCVSCAHDALDSNRSYRGSKGNEKGGQHSREGWGEAVRREQEAESREHRPRNQARPLSRRCLQHLCRPLPCAPSPTSTPSDPTRQLYTASLVPLHVPSTDPPCCHALWQAENRGVQGEWLPRTPPYITSQESTWGACGCV